MDKAARIGIRMADLLDREAFKEKLERNLVEKIVYLKNVRYRRFHCRRNFRRVLRVQQIAQYVCDTSVVLNDALDNNHRVLFEGAQGVMLDIDHGTYRSLHLLTQLLVV